MCKGHFYSSKNQKFTAQLLEGLYAILPVWPGEMPSIFKREHKYYFPFPISAGLPQFFVIFPMKIGYTGYKNGVDNIMNEEIYIAEDEDGIRLTVKTFLESEGYAVSDFPNGDLLYDAFLDKQPDLVILDVMMPGSSGFEITKKIRDISSVPIIILTAKDSDMDYATGINLGSDDYFTKPFSAIALNMRVKAMLRRIKMDQERLPVHQEDTTLRIGDIEIDLAAMSVKQNGTSLNLTPNEYNVFVYLIENKNRAVSRDELLDSIWGYGKDIETRACDDTVRRLRKKLAGSTVEIETVWGFGFTVKESSEG